MSMLGFLKSSDQAMKAVVKGGDMLVLTAEERVQYNQKATELYIEHMAKVADQSTPTSISRRFVALLVICPFVFLVLGSALFKAIGTFINFDPPKLDEINDLASHWAELATDNFGFAVISVVIFYFGTHAVGAFGSVMGGKDKKGK